jgi:ribosome-binding ATPase YchF (GTP1/OBG family)
MPYDVFMQYGSEQAVKDAGRFQIEGKDYVVSDGDIMSIRFNV